MIQTPLENTAELSPTCSSSPGRGWAIATGSSGSLLFVATANSTISGIVIDPQVTSIGKRQAAISWARPGDQLADLAH